jgi:hypothetical protein
MEHQITLIMERRKHARLTLRVRVLIRSAEFKDPVPSETVNISTNGFYCTTKEPFAPGDRLRALLSIPPPDDSIEGELYLDANIEVMRVCAINVASVFGLGCRIAEYQVLDVQTALKWPSERGDGC